MRKKMFSAPILDYFNNNYLSEEIFNVLENSGYNDKDAKSIKEGFVFFMNRPLKIDYIDTIIHEKLLDISNFEKAKVMLQNSTEVTGLLLLPNIIFSDFSNVPEYIEVNTDDYPINALLYSWLSFDNHDKILNSYEESWGDDRGRELFIIPFCDDRVTQATGQFHMVANDEIYGEDYNENGREWYGKILDYTMSFLIYKEIELNNISKENIDENGNVILINS